jgi:hypothetical protein
VIVGIAEVHGERVAVIRISEGHTVLSKALLGGLEIVNDERDVPEPGRLGLASGRLALRLKQPELQPRLAEEHWLVVVSRLIQLRQPEDVPVPRDRTRAVGDVEGYVIETSEFHTRHPRFLARVSSPRGPMARGAPQFPRGRHRSLS